MASSTTSLDARCATSASSPQRRLALGNPPNLPGQIVLAAILDYLAMPGTTGRTASLSRLATEPGGPGRAFRLNEDQLAEFLTPVVANNQAVSLSARAGAVQLGWRGDAADLAHQVVCEFYGSDPARPHVAGPAARDANVDLEIELLLTEQARAVVL